MGNFNKFGHGGGRPSFGGGGGRFGGRGDGPREMHQATCSKCGQGCEVPFRPTSDRAVFCSNCFKRGDAPTSNFAPKSFGGDRDRDRGRGDMGGGFSNARAAAPDAVTKAQIDALNGKLDKILALLTTPKVMAAPKTEPEVKTKKVVAKKAKATKKSKS